MVSTRRRALIGFAYSLTGNVADAEEFTAEALARCWSALRRRPIDQLELYVRRTIVNLMIQRSRRRRIEERHLPHARDDWRLPADIDEWCDIADLESTELVAALRELPAHHRAAIVARFIFDHSEAETALILSVPVGTVKSRCARALAALRETLAAQ